MSTTGWTGEPPDAEAAAMPLSGLLMQNRERGPGDELLMAAARSAGAEAREARLAAAGAPDPDERAAAMINRGLAPGMITDLGQRLAEVEAQLAGEEAKLERSARRSQRIQRDHAAGRITAFDIARTMGDGDDGDEAAVERLRRRAGRLRGQLADAQAAITPQQERVTDPLEAASRHAHQVFVEATRAKMAAAQAGLPAPRPFGSPSRGGVAVRSEVTCSGCLDVGASPEESFLIHQDPEPPRIPAVIDDAELAEFGRQAGTAYRPAW